MSKILSKKTLAMLAVVSALPFGSAYAQDKISMQMNWTADSAHLGFVMAEKLGIYDKHNLDVTLIEGRGSAVAAQLVASGQVELGFADTVAAINIAAQGAPIRIISTIWKSGQFGVQSLETANINEPKDLVGKRLAVNPGAAAVPLIPVFLKANGISESDVEIINASDTAFIGLLTSGQVDAVARTPENVVVPLAAEGYKANNMYFYDHGVPLASLSLVALDDKLKENPDMFRRFIEATAQGWQEAMKDPKTAVDTLKEMFPETQLTHDALMQGAVYSFNSVCPGGAGDTIGVTDTATWDKMYDVMTTAMGVPADRPVTDYYTNDYVPQTPVTCQ